MKTADAIRYYKTLGACSNPRVLIAEDLGCTRSYVYQWGKVVPIMSAWRLQAVTRGALKVDLRCYPKARRIDLSA